MTTISLLIAIVDVSAKLRVGLAVVTDGMEVVLCSEDVIGNVSIPDADPDAPCSIESLLVEEMTTGVDWLVLSVDHAVKGRDVMSAVKIEPELAWPTVDNTGVD